MNIHELLRGLLGPSPSRKVARISSEPRIQTSTVASFKLTEPCKLWDKEGLQPHPRGPHCVLVQTQCYIGFFFIGGRDPENVRC